MIIPMSYTHLGYNFLDKAGVLTLHSGVDLNYGKPTDDLNKPVHAMANGEVVYSQDTGKGWGNLIVLYHPAYGCWSRYGHLNERKVLKGAKVKEGQLIGLCGKSGGNWTPHLHWDVLKKGLHKWTQYTKGWSAEKVQEFYYNPLKYVGEIIEAEKSEPDIVKWHKKYRIIQEWSTPPTPEELKLAFAVYKGLKAMYQGTLTFDL